MGKDADEQPIDPLDSVQAVHAEEKPKPPLEFPTFENVNTLGYPTFYEKFFITKEYLDILEYIKLDNQFENNENPEEKALKLALMFGTKEKVLEYFKVFSKHHPNVHNIIDIEAACLFQLPLSNSPKHFSHWRNLASKNQCGNMFKPEFKYALTISQSIESTINDNKKNAKMLLVTLSLERCNSHELNEKLAQCNQICEQYEKNIPYGIRDNIGLEGYKKSINEQVRLRAKRSLFTADQPFQQFNLEMITDIANKVLLNPDVVIPAKQSMAYFIKQGISQAKFYEFLELDRRHAGTNIPDILIDGNTFGLPGFYLKKLNVQQQSEADLAGCLGRLSKCCMSYSGELGEACVKHGLTSPNGGFYVLFKGDANNQTLEDPVICQSWAWRSKSGALVIDSIEAPDKTESVINIVKPFYYTLTYELIKNHNINQVRSGMSHTSTGISKALCISNDANHVLEVPNDYPKGYRDSHEQFTIAADNQLYLLPGKANEFFEKTKSLLPIAPEFISMIEFALKTNNNELLVSYNTKFPVIGKKIIQRCSGYINKLSSSNLKEMIEGDVIQPYLLNLSSRNGESLLYMAASKNQWDIVKDLNKKGAALYAKNNGDRTTLHLAAQNGQLDIIRELIKQNTQTIDLNPKNADGETPLFLAAGQNHWNVVEELMIQGTDVHSTNNQGNTVVHLAANTGNSSIINLFLKKGGNINAVNNFGETALHLAAWNGKWDFIKTLVHYGAEVDIKNTQNKTVIDFAMQAKQFEFIKDMIRNNKFPPQKALFIAARHGNLELVQWLLLQGANLNAKDASGSTILHKAAWDGHVNLIKWLTEQGEPNADIVNKRGETALALAVRARQQAVVELLNQPSILHQFNRVMTTPQSIHVTTEPAKKQPPPPPPLKQPPPPPSLPGNRQ